MNWKQKKIGKKLVNWKLLFDTNNLHRSMYSYLNHSINGNSKGTTFLPIMQHAIENI